MEPKVQTPAERYVEILVAEVNRSNNLQGTLEDILAAEKAVLVEMAYETVAPWIKLRIGLYQKYLPASDPLDVTLYEKLPPNAKEEADVIDKVIHGLMLTLGVPPKEGKI